MNAPFQNNEKAQWMEEQYHRFRAESRQRVFMSIAVFCNHNRPIDGYYLEFGCHGARTMRMAWDATRHLYDWTYVAFDSFEGLPALEPIDEMPIWQAGGLKTSEHEFVRTVLEHGMPRDRLVTVKGFFQQSLTQELKERLLPRKAAVVYIDCDLYASTVPVLEFARDFLRRGTILVFDDWFCFYGDPDRGERRAFREFRERYPHLRFEEFLQTSEVKAFVFLGDGN